MKVHVDPELELDFKKVGQAALMLGIKNDVEVRVAPDDEEHERCLGWATFKHVVYVRAGKTAGQTRQILLHELAHCSQVENEGATTDESRPQREREAHGVSGSPILMDVLLP